MDRALSRIPPSHVKVLALRWRRRRTLRSFEKHGLVGPARDDKDCVLFPEKVKGKIAMLHRLDSKIQIAYFDNIDAIINSDKFWREYVAHFDDFEIIRPKYAWEEWKIGVGPPPIKTDRGWLVIYHGVDTARLSCRSSSA